MAVYKKRIPVVIDRKRWQRGGGYSHLRDHINGKMCCLGFVGKACGLHDKAITGVATPTDVFNRGYSDNESFAQLVVPVAGPEDNPIYENTPLTDSLMWVNDTRLREPGNQPSCFKGITKPETFERKREQVITRWLGKLGFDVTFVN